MSTVNVYLFICLFLFQWVVSVNKDGGVNVRGFDVNLFLV